MKVVISWLLLPCYIILEIESAINDREICHSQAIIELSCVICQYIEVAQIQVEYK